MQGFTTMVRRIWSALLKAKAGFVWYVREFSGEAKYDHYLEHFASEHPCETPLDRTRILAHARGIRSQASQHQLLLLKLIAIHKQSPSFHFGRRGLFFLIFMLLACDYSYTEDIRLHVPQSIFRNQEASPMLYFNVITRIADCVTLSAKAESAAAFAFKPSKTC